MPACVASVARCVQYVRVVGRSFPRCARWALVLSSCQFLCALIRTAAVVSFGCQQFDNGELHGMVIMVVMRARAPWAGLARVRGSVVIHAWHVSRSQAGRVQPVRASESRLAAACLNVRGCIVCVVLLASVGRCGLRVDVQGQIVSGAAQGRTAKQGMFAV